MSKATHSTHSLIKGTTPGSLVEPLSQREVEVLQGLTSGASNREIGQRLHISEGTVKRHVYHIFGKLQVHNRTQAALQAHKLGIDPQPNFLQL